MKENLLRESLRESIPEDIILPEGKLLLAFSGGSDSLFLLIILALLAPERTECVYINHALRPCSELENEISLNRQNASSLGIPMRVVNVPHGAVTALSKEKNIGVEAAAREIRYGILRRIRKEEGFSRILTAHHREDQVETVLMRILAGAPFYAYQGIIRDDGEVFRPILSVPKAEIMRFLAAAGLRWSEDSTNSDTGYLRNMVRRKILLLISEEERWSLFRIASGISVIRKRWIPIPYTCSFFIEADRRAFLSAPPFCRDEFIFEAFRMLGRNEGRVSRRTVDEICIKARSGKGRIDKAGLFFYFSDSALRIYPPLDDFVLPYDGKDLHFQGLVLKKAEPDSLTLVLDEAKLSCPVILRTSREGDRIALRDGERKVSELEKDMRVPYSLVLEDRNGIVAYFARFAGGRDRLSAHFLSSSPAGSALAIEMEYRYIQKDESYGR